MDYKVSDLRSVEADRYICKPFPNREFERDKQKPLSLLKTFYKLFYWIKKESTNNNYNGLPGGVWSLVDRYICKPVSNRKFERDKTKPLSLL